MRSWTAPAALLSLTLSGCGPQTPEQAQIANIQHNAAAEVEALESASRNQIAGIEAQADTLAQQAGLANGFEAERLNTRAEALRNEAKIVARHGKAQVRAVRDRARADVSAVRAR